MYLRPPDYQKQYSLVQRENGSIAFVPINRFVLTLPSELISEIFLHCLPDIEFIIPEPSSAPMLLCRICRKWRHIALATPGLWASLYMDLDWFFPEPPLDLNLGVFLCEWLSHARNMPLSLHVDDDPAFDTDAPSEVGRTQFAPVLNMIGRLSAQWRNVSLRVAPVYFQDVCPSGTFPLLKKLAVPRAEISETLWMLAIPWAQLTVFRSEKISVCECVYVLRNGPTLLECAFSIFPESYPVRAVLSPLAPLNLRALEITDKTTQLLTATLLHHLTLPALQCLTLRFGTTRHIHHDISDLISFASRCSLQLQELTLCLMPTTEAVLIQCLQSFPSLVNLRLQLRKAADGLLHLFQSDLKFLRRLESLHIVQNSPHRTVPAVPGLLEMLVTRWDSRLDSKGSRLGQLRSFQFEHSGSARMTAFAALVVSDPSFRQLKEEGMQLYVGAMKYQATGRPWYVRWEPDS
ncbi:hypothetical protein C8R44DRAFT_871098 [Mycena epipterygia]|nr:hypothetical protein C8R44DRAFT_871098 [Mycena epipterygia]